MAQQVNDPALPLQWLWWLLWCGCGFDPRPSRCSGCDQKKKKKVLQATTQVCSWLLKWTVGVSELSPLPMESAATSVECQN